MLKTTLELQGKKDVQAFGPSLSRELERIIENKLTDVSQHIQTNLIKEMKQTLVISTSESISDQSKQLKVFTSKLDTFIGTTGQNSELVLSKLNGTLK